MAHVIPFPQPEPEEEVTVTGTFLCPCGDSFKSGEQCPKCGTWMKLEGDE